MTNPEYLMWFSRYGTPHLETQECLDDCYQLAHMLDDAETYIFDQYGCLDTVERIGHGTIPETEWDEGLENYTRRKRAESRAAVARTGCWGVVQIRPPADSFAGSAHWRKAWETYGQFYDPEIMLEVEQRLRAQLGNDRVESVWYKSSP